MLLDLEETIFDACVIDSPEFDYVAERASHMNEQNGYLFSFLDALIESSAKQIYTNFSQDGNALASPISLHVTSAAKKLLYLENVLFYDMVEKSFLSYDVEPPYVSPLACETLLTHYSKMQQKETLDFCFDMQNELKESYPLLIDGIYLKTEFASEYYTDIVEQILGHYYHVNDSTARFAVHEFSEHCLISLTSVAACLYKGTATSLELPESNRA